MRYVCSYCHTPIEAEPDDEHKVCPRCKAEAGIEPVKDKAPVAMQYFGLILLVAGVMAVGGSFFGLAS
ncbi:hypothetical protein ENSA5_25810 [Enhygromyxa salina]|uniref:Uncharacterized protein n=1 Tax=Enhygromyxa salina TaxID=215803 RepID=A0A2S9YAP0_9BACT|nr:hypothetical protein [Enhygromyxa salina]PRQ02122.1 hypothetical protein ENSA5_25810 [Enhygromyxa salina]